MVSNVCRFEYILTDSELEALILECNLIKEYRPYCHAARKWSEIFITIFLHSNFNFSEELKKMPQTPGVYLMHDNRDDIIYVGKAVNLKSFTCLFFISQPSFYCSLFYVFSFGS